MAEEEGGSTTKRRCAVVTGANKGIGFEICRQLASRGIAVVLTARDVHRGTQAVDELLQQHSSSSSSSSSSSHLVVFHQLDVTDPASVQSLARFITSTFGKLDILVNNAGISGVVLDSDAFVRAFQMCGGFPTGDLVNWNELGTDTYDLAVECVETNYYGVKRMVEALVPLLNLSSSPRIVNVSSAQGLLQNIPSERVRRMLGDGENLSEEKVDQVLNEFLKDIKEGLAESKGWPSYLSAYTVSKASLNAYTRILGKKWPRFCINSVCPGYVKTDITCKTGIFTADEGAEMPVKLALLPDDGPSGLFFRDKQISSF